MRPRSEGNLETALLLALLIAMLLWQERRRVAVIEENMRVELGRRHTLQDRLETREEQLDGALGRIKELMPDEHAPSGE